MLPVSWANTHHDTTYFVNHGMVKNTKTCISWEKNIIFQWNKTILNLCFRQHILRSYCFVAEVTFKMSIKALFWAASKSLQCLYVYIVFPQIMLPDSSLEQMKDLKI